MITRTISLLALVFLAACSTITQGTAQTIHINTEPDGANCRLTRHGEQIGYATNTPAIVEISKTKYDIEIRCSKKGYRDAFYNNSSDTAGMTFGNILLGGGIGWAIDSSVGADNKYESNVFMKLEKL